MLEIRQLIPASFSESERAQFTDMAGKQPLSDDIIDLHPFGAYWDGEPCGLLIISFIEVLQKADIEQFFVKEAYRQKGVATALLQFAENEMRQRGCKTLILMYSDEIEGHQGLERILQKGGWRQPSLFIKRYHFHCPSFRPDWLYEPHPLPPEITMHDWSELTAKERSLIEHQVNQGVFSYSLYPFTKGTEPEPTTSVFLRTEGKVIGWSVCHLEKPDTLTYTALYIHSNYRGKRIGIVIAAESVLRQQRGTIPYSVFDVQARPETDIWTQFVAKSVEAHALKITGVWSVWKRLSDQTSE